MATTVSQRVDMNTWPSKVGIYYLRFLISATFPLFGIVTISATKLKMVKRVQYYYKYATKKQEWPQLFCFITWISLLYCGPNFLSLHSLVFPHFLYVALIKKRRKYMFSISCLSFTWYYSIPMINVVIITGNRSNFVLPHFSPADHAYSSMLHRM